jgi:GNAT superfamily N-acetyltransferase
MSGLGDVSREGLQPIQFDIRVGTTADIGKMALVMERANAARDGQQLLEVVTDEYRLAEIHTRMGYMGAWSYLAENEKESAGFVLGHPSFSEDTIESREEDEYLALLMIEPRYWGKGVGSTLLDKAADKAITLGRERLILWTVNDNSRARQLYERKGYILANKQRHSKRQPEVVLERYDLDLGLTK